MGNFFKTLNDHKSRSLDVVFRCMDAPFTETSRRELGRQWWRYDDNGNGDRPADWAEMVHTISVLAHRGDPRMQGVRMPRFGISLSGAVNPGHFEAPGAGGPPHGCLGP